MADYYVDAEFGNDDWPGTEAQPWRTIVKAGLTLVAGDAAHVMTGSYVGDVRFANSGQIGQPITFQGAQGQRPVIASGLRGFDMDYVDHIVTDGFEIIGLSWTKDDEGSAITGLNSRFCTVRNCLIHGNPGHGILGYGAEGWEIENCRIERNGFFGVFLSRSQAGIDPDYCTIQRCDILHNGFIVEGDEGSGIFFNASGSHCQIEDNICVGNAGNGILMGGTCGHNVIARNRCHGNGWYGIWVSADVTATIAENNILKWNDVQWNNGGIALSKTRSNDVYRNIIANNDLELGRVGGGLIFRRSEGDRAWNNVIWGNQFVNSAAGIQVGAWWEGDHEPCTDIILLNNIIGNNQSKRNLQGSVEAGSSIAREDYNDWYGEVAGFEPGPHSINADPLLQDDFRLGPGSPCIGTGVADPEFPESMADMGVFAAEQQGCNQIARLFYQISGQLNGG